jgi:hypothetical protein
LSVKKQQFCVTLTYCTQESIHPYTDDITLSGHVRIPGAEALRVEFDRACSTERRHDPLSLMDAAGRVVAVRSGREWADWSPELRVGGEELRWKFSSDGSVNGWGWRFTVYPVMPSSSLQVFLSKVFFANFAVLRIWVPVAFFTPGSGICFFRIPDPNPIFLRT